MTTTDDRAAIPLLRLLAWLSPAFPVGAFSYSGGLERAAHDGVVGDPQSLRDWVETVLEHGSAWNDSVLLAETWRRAAAGKDVSAAVQLAEALAGTAERHLEATGQGAAFAAAAANWPGLVFPEGLGPRPCYAVAVGAMAGANGIALHDACAAFLQAYVSGVLQAAIRLSVVGQSDAVVLTGLLEAFVADVAGRAAVSTLDDLGGAAIMADVLSMTHETQYSRLFRS